MAAGRPGRFLTGHAARGGLCVPSMGDDLEVKVLWNN
jgi:hypothetical protein